MRNPFEVDGDNNTNSAGRQHKIKEKKKGTKIFGNEVISALVAAAAVLAISALGVPLPMSLQIIFGAFTFVSTSLVTNLVSGTLTTTVGPKHTIKKRSIFGKLGYGLLKMLSKALKAAAVLLPLLIFDMPVSLLVSLGVAVTLMLRKVINKKIISGEISKNSKKDKKKNQGEIEQQGRHR